MNYRRIFTSLAAIAVTVSTVVCADEIYKWTDENGDVHYGDRPTGEVSEERIPLTYNRTDSAALQDRVASYDDATQARHNARADADERKLSAAEERAAAEEERALCEEYRAKLTTMVESHRVYRLDEAGERVYLDEVERAEASAQAQKIYKERCSG